LGNESDISLEQVLKRVGSFCDAETDSEIATRLGVSRQTLSGWKRRNAIPYETLVAFAKERGLSLNYILWGDESEYLDMPTGERMLIDSFGQMTHLNFRPGSADVSLDSADVNKILKACSIYEKMKESPDQDVLKSLDLVINALWESDDVMEITARVPIATNNVRLVPEVCVFDMKDVESRGPRYMNEKQEDGETYQSIRFVPK